jgi:hypothetical protein
MIASAYDFTFKVNNPAGLRVAILAAIVIVLGIVAFEVFRRR